MSRKQETNESLADANSASVSSDVCVVDNSSGNSAKSMGWRHSPPSSTKPNYSPRANVSPILNDVTTPPTPNRPISGLKRTIRATSRPPSPKRKNREIEAAIVKLRPVRKFTFNKPNGNSPNTKFTTEETKFTANCSTPKRSNARSTNNSYQKSSLNTNRSMQPNQRPSPTSPHNLITQNINRPGSPRPRPEPEILENIIIKKAHTPQSPDQPEKHPQHPSNSQNSQQFIQQLNQQKQAVQQQLQLIEQQLHNSTHHPQQPPQITKSKTQCTPPITPPLLSPNQAHPVATQNYPFRNTTKKETFERQFENHIKTARKSALVVESPTFPQMSTLAPNSEQPQPPSTQQQKQPQPQLTNIEAPIRIKHNSPTTNKANSSTHKTTIPIANNKIPSIFIPQISSIENLFSIIKNSAKPIHFTTTCGQEKGLRVKCSDIDSYRGLLELLQTNNVHLHTHQMPQDRGVRMVIKGLHATTPNDTIRSLLSNLGYTIKYINVLRNKFSGIPLNTFEIEIDPKTTRNTDDLLKINRLGSQEVVVERQALRIEPVQCHRCQAYGHSKNYCRRPFVCLKCAGAHPTVECKKDRNSPGLCANCGNQHIASYKGCPVYKVERSKLLATKLANLPATSEIADANAHAQRQPRTISATYETLPKLIQPEIPISKPPKQAPTPQPQRVRMRAPNINSPKPSPQTKPIAAPLGPLRTTYGYYARKTYSQTASEATSQPKSPMPNRQFLTHQPQLPQKPSLNPYQQQLPTQQPNRPQQTYYPNKPNSQVSFQTHQHDLAQLHNAVSNNAQSITLLSNKIDMLFKKFNEHFGLNTNDKINPANDNPNVNK